MPSKIKIYAKASFHADEIQEKIKELQNFISHNYYTCTTEILGDLGQMYACDERFKRNIDKAGGEGTAEFVNRAIAFFCDKMMQG